MLPNLFEATKEYWAQLDDLEMAYQQGKLSLEEVDVKVADLMAELAQERRAAFTFFWRSLRHWLTFQKETLISLAVLGFLTYFWVLTSQLS